jgi:hypothetical protein
MLDHFEELGRSAVWLGPAVLGALFYRLVADPAYAAADDLAGVIMLATGAIILTAAGVRLNQAKGHVVVPTVFATMFVVSWLMR